MLSAFCKYLTTIPQARMDAESIAPEAGGQMGHWLGGHEDERNNCLGKIQLVGQKNIEAKQACYIIPQLCLILHFVAS